MPYVGIKELKNQTTEILRGVREEGLEYVVTFHGRPVAVLLPIAEDFLAGEQRRARRERIPQRRTGRGAPRGYANRILASPVPRRPETGACEEGVCGRARIKVSIEAGDAVHDSSAAGAAQSCKVDLLDGSEEGICHALVV